MSKPRETTERKEEEGHLTRAEDGPPPGHLSDGDLSQVALNICDRAFDALHLRDILDVDALVSTRASALNRVRQAVTDEVTDESLSGWHGVLYRRQVLASAATQAFYKPTQDSMKNEERLARIRSFIADAVAIDSGALPDIRRLDPLLWDVSEHLKVHAEEPKALLAALGCAVAFMVQQEEQVRREFKRPMADVVRIAFEEGVKDDEIKRWYWEFWRREIEPIPFCRRSDRPAPGQAAASDQAI